MPFVVDGPFDLLALGEVEGLGHGAGEVDIPLLALLAFDGLDFGKVTHAHNI
jgi:hypothetical protein